MMKHIQYFWFGTWELGLFCQCNPRYTATQIRSDFLTWFVKKAKNVFHLPSLTAWFQEISLGYCGQHMPNWSTQIGNKHHPCSLGIGDLQAAISSLWLRIGIKHFHAIWACLRFHPSDKTQTKAAHLLPAGAANTTHKSGKQEIFGDHGTECLTHTCWAGLYWIFSKWYMRENASDPNRLAAVHHKWNGH